MEKSARTLAALAALVVMGLMVSTTEAATKSPGKNQLTLVASSNKINSSACGNPYNMQPDASVYTTVCFVACTVGASAQLWAVVTQNFEGDVAVIQANYGCKGWYYWKTRT